MITLLPLGIYYHLPLAYHPLPGSTYPTLDWFFILPPPSRLLAPLQSYFSGLIKGPVTSMITFVDSLHAPSNLPTQTYPVLNESYNTGSANNRSTAFNIVCHPCYLSRYTGLSHLLHAVIFAYHGIATALYPKNHPGRTFCCSTTAHLCYRTPTFPAPLSRPTTVLTIVIFLPIRRPGPSHQASL